MAGGPLAPEQVRLMALQVLAALDAAHRAGIVHRDIKPANILLAADGTWKLGDFGIAKAAESVDLTRTGMLLGTPAYLAPERIDGHRATASSDIYSLGVVMYEALAGRRPFDATDALALAML